MMNNNNTCHEGDNLLLKEALEATQLLPKDYNFQQGRVNDKVAIQRIYQIIPEFQLFQNRTVIELPKLRRCLNYTQTNPEFQQFHVRLMQYLINECISETASNRMYFKVIEMTNKERVHFFEVLFSYYEMTIMNQTSMDEEKQKYAEVIERFFTSPNSEQEITLYILKEELQAIMYHHPHERMEIYRRLLEDRKYDFTNHDLTEVLIDMIRLDEYELFLAYVTTFKQELRQSNEITNRTSLIEIACYSHSLNIVKYLIEIVGMDYTQSSNMINRVRTPIVMSVMIQNNNNNFNTYRRYQISNKYVNNNHHHNHHLHYKQMIEIEKQKQRSLLVVRYLLEIYKQHNRYDELAQKTLNYNSIIRVAYENDNIPVLLHLKEIGFNIANRFEYLRTAVGKSNIEAVRLFWSEYRLWEPNLHPEDEFQERAKASDFIEALYNSSRIESLEILNVFEEFGIDFNKCPIILGSARWELFHRFDFQNALIGIDNAVITSHCYLIIRNLLRCENFSLEYLFALFSRYPICKCKFETNYLSSLHYYFKGFMTQNFNFKVKLQVLIVSFALCAEFYPQFRVPCVTHWVSVFNTSIEKRIYLKKYIY